MVNEIFEYMKETSRKADGHTLKLLEDVKENGRNIYQYISHLPILRNRLIDGNSAMPKSRNVLGRLVYESLSDDDWTKIIPALSFIEMSTISTYVLDDIMDNQIERQGEEATWKKYGINKGICAGGIQSFKAIKSLDNLILSDSRKLEVYSLALDMWDKLWIGQSFNEEMKEGTTFDEYIKRCYNICGVMFDTISQISAICADTPEEKIKIVSNIGRNYGIATMIRNDLVDLIPRFRKHSRALSKAPYEDLDKGIWTFPIIYLAKQEKMKSEEIKEIIDNHNDAKYDYLNKILKKSGAVDATLELITEYRKKVENEISIGLSGSKMMPLFFKFTNLLENLRGYV